ncbi:lysine decarboxylase [Pontibacillus halophilus JSM 076056 = DSM 19796]|uniref:Lysine decarboxylase n=1 Tax=Pontibacillus halophilus JSM 076056 = DSM 19796 TaxID=1385510 RepID=A0A0A5GAB3_9BACI|nr:aminotransferase class I/II-fold pyridoxal phosphate-dependent enzyme [Pontibacillus halophilus]KGX90106.1 lysine decarboxylase [Pontibacillus halophilus JSM 076056 = DSM 19796]
MIEHQRTPLYETLVKHRWKGATSYHVPGHKNGNVFYERGKTLFQDILSIDLTEISGLDDLHEPGGVIQEAQELASTHFGSRASYFLVGGSTAGNLASVLAASEREGPILIQRNSHKSIYNGLELSGASTVLIAPRYSVRTGLYHDLHVEDVIEAVEQFQDASAIVLTYPDYYGNTYDLKSIIDYAHQFDIPVIVDEAHGVHLHLDPRLPSSAIELGADIVVHSAHKMAPAMTMGAFLHHCSSRVDINRIQHYLQLIQSSSPSYPIMASLDLSRAYLASLDEKEIGRILERIETERKLMASPHHYEVIPHHATDDPFKTTLRVQEGYNGQEIARRLEGVGLFPELVQDSHILLVHGLDYSELNTIEKRWEKAHNSLKSMQGNHATIETEVMNYPAITRMPYPYQQLKHWVTKEVTAEEAVGQLSACSVIPYPPGIPLIAKGEIITEGQINELRRLQQSNLHIQSSECNLQKGLLIYER